MGFQHLYPEKVKLQREATFNHYKERGATLNDLELELACFRNIPFGHPLKGEFCISLAMMRWDFLYVEKDGIENYWFTRMLRAMCKHRRVYLVGSASAGKTFTSAIWGMNMWAASPWDTTMLVTSTTKESLESKAWGAIKDLHEKDKLKIGVRVDYEDAIVLEKSAKQRDIRDAIRAKALPKGSEGRKAIGELQGRKNYRIAWIRDEYDHMDGFVADAEGNLSAVPEYHAISCSNRPEQGGPMWHEAMPNMEEFPLGWETDGLDKLTEWKTESGAICLYFDGELSPNMESKKEEGPFDMLTRKGWVNRMRERGSDDFQYWMYVRAFPKAGATSDRLLTTKVLERYEADQEVVWSGSPPVSVCGLDPSWTKGGDACVADFGRVGFDYRGVKVLSHELDTVTISLSLSGNGTFEEQIAASFINECDKRNCHIVAIDISGSGGRVANAIRDEATRRNYRLEIIAVDSAGSPDETEIYLVGDTKKTGKEAFDRRVSELWYSYRLDVEAGLIRGCNIQCKAVKELCDRRVSTDDKKKFEIEAKDEYKKRNKGKSPDHAEARILLRYAAKKHGLGATLLPKAQSSFTHQIDKALGRQEERPSAYGWKGGGRSAYSW